MLAARRLLLGGQMSVEDWIYVIVSFVVMANAFYQINRLYKDIE